MKKIASSLLLAMTLCACAVRDPIQMKTMPLKLMSKINNDNATVDRIILEWQSLDGKIKIETIEHAEDSSAFKVGTIYPNCFLPR